MTEKARESQSESLRPPSPTERAKIEAVLSRSVKIQYFLSRKCRLRAVKEKEKRADPEVYPALRRETRKEPNNQESLSMNQE